MGVYSLLSDNELVCLLRKGDEIAYTEIYDRFAGLLYTFVHKKLKDEEDAKDIIQELFANIWTKRETLEFSGLLPAYLYTAVRNKMLDLVGHKKIEDKYIKSLQDFMDRDNVLSDHLIREKQLISLIEHEINALPTRMREVFLLSRKANLSYREIADQLELSEQTVRSHVKHALRILRTRLGLFSFLFCLFGFF